MMVPIVHSTYKRQVFGASRLLTICPSHVPPHTRQFVRGW